MSQVKEDTPMFPALPAVAEFPAGVDRRSFLVRSAVIGAAFAMTGCDMSK